MPIFLSAYLIFRFSFVSIPHADHFNARPPIPPSNGPGSSLPPKALLLGTALAAGGLFGLFQLGLLPKSWSARISKVYFWPTLPFTMLRRLDNYWTKMDGERLLYTEQYEYTVTLNAQRVHALTAKGRGRVYE